MHKFTKDDAPYIIYEIEQSLYNSGLSLYRIGGLKMILTLKKGTSEKEIERISNKIKEIGFTPYLLKGVSETIIGVIGDNAILKKDIFESMDSVAFITQISKPYKLASREIKSENSIIDVDGVKIGGDKITVMAGPCSIENRDMMLDIAKETKDAGASILRGGAFKPRTSPYSFQGLGEEGLKYMKEAKEITGMPIVTEIMNANQADVIAKYADMMQIGARNMQNFDLLKVVGELDIPILLKRGMSATIKEFLMSAEYIMSRGNEKVILCERGIRTFETSTRFTLDLSAVPVIKEVSHLPIIIDPSHAAGKRYLVGPLAKAAVAVGADGLIIEVHNSPQDALSDGPQLLLPKDFKVLMDELKQIAKSVGREI